LPRDSIAIDDFKIGQPGDSSEKQS
jgi:hypothetical protein